MKVAQDHEAQNLAMWSGKDGESAVELISASFSNQRVQSLIETLQDLSEIHITYIPTGALALYPPYEEAPDQVTNVKQRSPIEIFLDGLQSIGSWPGFLSYAVLGAVTAWIGLFTDTVVLLIAAMLIAPFAGPAMTLALASAHGDLHLLRRSLIRYFVALGVAILVAMAMSALLRQDVATSQMVAAAKVSAVAALIPLIAGAAGAMTLVQSERSSLVSGTATGLLVAATLAPPAAVVGMAVVIREWSMAMSGIFLLLLQLTGIQLGGSLVFRYFGEVTHKTTRYNRGNARVFPASLVVSGLVLAGLLFWQFTGSPDLFRATREQRTRATIQDIVSSSGVAHLVEANARFTQPNISNQNTLLVIVYVQKDKDSELSTEQIDQMLTEQIEERLTSTYQVTPLVDVQVFTVPAEASSSSSQ